MSRRKRHRDGSGTSPTRRDLPLAELVGIVERAKNAPLSATDYATLKMAVDTLAFLEARGEGTTIERLRKMLFGAAPRRRARSGTSAPIYDGRR